MSLFRELLTDAKRNAYAIPAINVQSAETMDAVLSAAKARKSPVIVALAHSHAGYTYNYIHISTMVALFEDARKRYDVTACLHVDHGRTFEFVQHAVDLGFHSVMTDASEHPYEQNVETVKTVVSYAHAHGAAVEAGLGHVGKGEASTPGRPSRTRSQIQTTPAHLPRKRTSTHSPSHSARSTVCTNPRRNRI